MARPTVTGSALPALLPCCLAACCFGLLLCACTCIRSVCAINKSAVIKSVQPSSLKDSQFSQRPVYSPLPAQLTLCSPLSVLHARLNCHPEFAFRASPARLLSQTPRLPILPLTPPMPLPIPFCWLPLLAPILLLVLCLVASFLAHNSQL